MGTDGELFSSQFYGNLGSTLGDEFILVYPDALGTPTAWDMQGAEDTDFFDTLLDLMSTTYCIDEARIFATGHSSGGYFTNTLACQRGDVLRAIGPVSGGGPFVFGTTCTGQVAAWITHGTADETVALTNGESSRDYWAEQNGCDVTQTTVPSPDYPCVEYTGCDAGFPVRWCEHPGGHDWPTFVPQGLYDFFASF